MVVFSLFYLGHAPFESVYKGGMIAGVVKYLDPLPEEFKGLDVFLKPSILGMIKVKLSAMDHTSTRHEQYNQFLGCAAFQSIRSIDIWSNYLILSPRRYWH